MFLTHSTGAVACQFISTMLRGAQCEQIHQMINSSLIFFHIENYLLKDVSFLIDLCILRSFFW